MPQREYKREKKGESLSKFLFKESKGFIEKKEKNANMLAFMGFWEGGGDIFAFVSFINSKI